MSAWLTWQNVLRGAALFALVALFLADYGFNVLAKDLPREVYFFLVAIVLGVDIKQLRQALLSLLGGGKGGGNAKT